ncbi:hypothetical protein ACVDG3_05375 [Meridianimarinicoccus sp. RP-17]|uniref:hypothetical protein n=1 Tax=Meridianimarinicoccus zhengii TaxID=2056810 RepID=UPI000DAC56BE|nr:hypothetical protein [Phycocomes zhengii]
MFWNTRRNSRADIQPGGHAGIGFLGRLRERREAAQTERDMITITCALARLNDRQLGRIGLNRATLALDVDHLAEHAEQKRIVHDDVLRIVDNRHAA